jgi:predicted transcriptional regulator
MQEKGSSLIIGNKKGGNKMFQITLKAARVNRGMTLKAAAKLFGVHYETLSNYENDCTNVPRTFFIRLEEVYCIPMERIYFGKQTDYWKSLKQQHQLKQHA